MKLNWKVRFKNKVWLGSFCSLVIGFVYSMLALFDVFPAVTQSLVVGFIYSLLALFDVFPAVTQNLVVQLLNQLLTFLGLIGVVVDPTTAGIGDSERAMGYVEPWNDDKE